MKRKQKECAVVVLPAAVRDSSQKGLRQAEKSYRETLATIRKLRVGRMGIQINKSTFNTYYLKTVSAIATGIS